MNPPSEFQHYFEKIAANGRKTLSDAQTKLFIQVNDVMYIVKVDNGIVQNNRDGIKKCDYLLFDELNLKTHLIELKGTIVDKAFSQLEKSIENIIKVGSLGFLVRNLAILDAYIVSPMRQRLPVGISSMERTLAKKLARSCSDKVSDILQLIKYVKVIPDCNHVSETNRRITCSNRAPLVL